MTTVLLAIFCVFVFFGGAYIMGKFAVKKTFKAFKTPIEDMNPVLLKVLYLAIGFLLWTAIGFFLAIFGTIFGWVAMLTY